MRSFANGYSLMCVLLIQRIIIMNVILVGPAGSGKGTQAEYIKEKFNLLHLSTGDMLRAEIASGSELGNEVKSVIDNGLLVSDDLMVSMIEKRIAKDDAQNGVIFDGFPRTLPQAKALDEMLTKNHNSINKVIEIQVPRADLIARITGRYTCVKCGAGYHKLFKQPSKEGVCDKCGSTDFSQRDDDNEESANKRLDAFEKLTAEILPYYKDQSKLYSVDGTKAIPEVTSQVMSAF